MAKRKRELEPVLASKAQNGDALSKIAKTNGHTDVKTVAPIIQIVCGSYERILHGITASISDIESNKPTVQFADSFLFNAHASAIKCVTISPLPDIDNAENQGLYLATGGSDERVNVYSLSASPMPDSDKIPTMPTLGSNKISENPRNRELGTLMQHSSNITALHFPTRSKLMSASEDNTIAITRVRDLTVVSNIKAPRPKVQGQPSGDTAPPGATPAGVNDFAVHPSMKLMISVGRAERCMRLWNLVTGKKAGVLNFDRTVLTAIKEGKYSSGEGRRIRWNDEGDEFAISFERGMVVFGADSKPRCTALPQPLTKIHQISYMVLSSGESILAAATEDGRIIFYNTGQTIPSVEALPPSTSALAQVGGRAAGVGSRIKDFKLLKVQQQEKEKPAILVVAASSDGAVRLWHVAEADIISSKPHKVTPQIGTQMGIYETSNRITCMDAFTMLPASDDLEGFSEFEGLTEGEDDSSSESE